MPDAQYPMDHSCKFDYAPRYIFGVLAVIVCHAKKFIFIHNPKAAGSTFRNMIGALHDHPVRFWDIHYDPYFQARLDMAHLRAWELPVVAPDVLEVMDEYQTLAFVRDPLERFMSACAEHFRQFRPRSRFHRWPAHGKRVLIQHLIRSGRIEANVKSNFQYVHFSPQVWFTHLGQRQIARHILPIRPGTDDLGRAFERLGVPVVAGPVINRTPDANWRATASPEIEGFVRRFYDQDYAMLANLPPDGTE